MNWLNFDNDLIWVMLSDVNLNQKLITQFSVLYELVV